MMNFYKVIYSERSLNPMAAKIVAEETDKMIIATKQLFYAMEVHKLLHFTNPDMSAVSFAMTIHGLMDYELDQSNGKCSYETDKNLLDDYLKWFVRRMLYDKEKEFIELLRFTWSSSFFVIYSSGCIFTARISGL